MKDYASQAVLAAIFLASLMFLGAISGYYQGAQVCVQKENQTNLWYPSTPPGRYWP